MEMYNVFIMAVDTPARVLPISCVCGQIQHWCCIAHVCFNPARVPWCGKYQTKAARAALLPRSLMVQVCRIVTITPYTAKCSDGTGDSVWWQNHVGLGPLFDHCGSSGDSCGLSKAAFSQCWPRWTIPSSSTGWLCEWPSIPGCALQLAPAALTPQRGAPPHHPAPGNAETPHNAIITHTQAGLLTGRRNGGSPPSSAAGWCTNPQGCGRNLQMGQALLLGQIMPSGTAGKTQLRVLPAVHPCVLLQCFLSQPFPPCVPPWAIPTHRR